MSGSLTIGFLWSWRRGKRSRHSRRMRNPQFYVSGKKPIPLYHRPVLGLGFLYSVLVLATYPSTEFLVLVLLLVFVKTKVMIPVLILMGKYSGTCMSTGLSTDIPWYMWNINVKIVKIINQTVNFEQRKVSNWLFYKITIRIIHVIWLHIPQTNQLLLSRKINCINQM